MDYHDNHRNLVDEIVDRIISELPSISMEKAANLSQDNFLVLELIVVSYIRNRLEQMDAIVKNWLMEDCLKKFKEPLDEVDPATIIFRELWRRLWKTHKMSDANWGWSGDN